MKRVLSPHCSETIYERPWSCDFWWREENWDHHNYGLCTRKSWWRCFRRTPNCWDCYLTRRYCHCCYWVDPTLIVYSETIGAVESVKAASDIVESRHYEWLRHHWQPLDSTPQFQGLSKRLTRNWAINRVSSISHRKMMVCCSQTKWNHF